MNFFLAHQQQLSSTPGFGLVAEIGKQNLAIKIFKQILTFNCFETLLVNQRISTIHLIVLCIYFLLLMIDFPIVLKVYSLSLINLITELHAESYYAKYVSTVLLIRLLQWGVTFSYSWYSYICWIKV